MMSAAVKESSKKASPSPLCGLSSLPDEMAINCFARLSRLDQAKLSMTSKSYRSLVLSPEFYETRSRMGYTEDYVYAFFVSRHKPNPLWFSLRRVKGKSIENRLVPIPTFPTPWWSSLVALGCGIYVIGGLIGSARTSLVSFLDCRTHKWSYLPSMRTARAYFQAGVFEGRIYVMGGCEKNDDSIWAEVFDPKLQIWSEVNIQDSEIKHCTWQQSKDKEVYNFRAEESMWNDLNKRGYSETERLLYCHNFNGNIMWCEPWSEVRRGRMCWRKVYGLDAMKESFRYTVRSVYCCGESADVWHYYMLKHGYLDGLSLPGRKLSISNGNIIIFWSKVVVDDEKKFQIWCTEISIERRKRGKVWGYVQWSEHVTTVDHLPARFEDLLSVTVSV